MILGFVAVGLVMFCFVPILVVTVRGPNATPDLDDHWHVAFGIYACDHFLEPLVDEDVDVHGIHTHGDGLVHIHPFDATVTGDRATLDVFARQVGLRELQRGGLQLSDGTTIDECEGRPADVTILRWRPGSASGEPPTRSTAGFSDTRFEADREFITAAVLPVDVELSDEAAARLRPPSVAGLDQISDQPGPGRTTTTLARASTTTTLNPVTPLDAVRNLESHFVRAPEVTPGGDEPTTARVEEVSGMPSGGLAGVDAAVPDRATARWTDVKGYGPMQLFVGRAASVEDAELALRLIEEQHPVTRWPIEQDLPEGRAIVYRWRTASGQDRVTVARRWGTDVAIATQETPAEDDGVGAKALATTALYELHGAH